LGEEMSLFCELYVRDKYSGRIHRVGDDVHDSLWVDEAGTVHYHNMQNGDGCPAFKSINTKKDINGDGYEYGFEFVPMMDGEMAEPYATQLKEQKAKEKEWEQMVKDLEERTANLKPDEISEDL
jgi:hypothetical protein